MGGGTALHPGAGGTTGQAATDGEEGEEAEAVTRQVAPRVLEHAGAVAITISP